MNGVLFRYNLSARSIDGECFFGDIFLIASSENIRRCVMVKVPLSDEG